MRYFIIIVSLGFVLSCVPHSENPLSEPNPAKIDLSILGTWFWKDENETGYIHIGLDEKSKLLKLVMIDIKSDGELNISEFFGHTSSLEGKNYLNLKWIRQTEFKIKEYIFVKYTVSQDSLGLALMDSDVVVRAIEGGSLKGKVGKDKFFSFITITEEQKKLQQFILQNDKALFPEIYHLPKLKLPNNVFQRSEKNPGPGKDKR